MVSLSSFIDALISQGVIAVNGHTSNSNDGGGGGCPWIFQWFCNLNLNIEWWWGWAWWICGWEIGIFPPCGICPVWAPLLAPCCSTYNDIDDNSDENDRCSNPPKNCSDCGGPNIAGLCFSGSETDCKNPFYIYASLLFPGRGGQDPGITNVATNFRQVLAILINAQAEISNLTAPIAKRALLPTHALLILGKTALVN
jgi:hypothetical protein